MAVKVVRRPELTFWEKLYIPQIVCGLKITFRHFFRNLFLHIAHRLGRLTHLRASVTIQYPEELRPLMSRFRSRHRPRVMVSLNGRMFSQAIQQTTVLKLPRPPLTSWLTKGDSRSRDTFFGMATAPHLLVA